ncbi:MAG: acyl-CoA dehydrogenase [Ignavibacteria bacterium GWA2_55_11]|nr:MAG: acyl-CoA dehydrogenase [Ignavibacteria bacterium GWA2_55_11]OGU43651.1 MAG: acyl-CoA dehydrogenase [Ignavibacteria bacterium GWC2_56_12]OGU63863.1 MAG: acyl-CoA dehydrogenase [Ignavibacteria bacterium RIFCSPHIGHO2_02_FULL_56_12]OGU69039.1 MAG: acyl-CoA dehydrogenase [Ignavibacteria bacterium RIFCSPLOWO2_02_FULL_55_14]OGU76419.1 MAG: acyl-CoA dehydrogenase [Ignavibacteria bacterium RIFCSPLOWO2_12_FULL_56_21]HAV23992.1 acyl-CoA dehydrogenase [Bacteroidota bacterium]
MPNYFLDNADIQFHFSRLDLREIAAMQEENYTQAKEFPEAPVDYDDAMTNYRKVLEVVGDLAGNRIAPRAAGVDHDGATLADGKVSYAPGTQRNVRELGQAELMGLIFPHTYDGLNFPFTIYMMAVEVMARADASLMNIFGLQDIGDTIKKFGTEKQRRQYLPEFSAGVSTGAMALTEPDAGSDLQAVKLQAYQNGDGTWFLRGVKRFITNGNGELLLVLARSEPGTKDGRGLSLFVCRSGKTVKIRRIENKLGIHGSPTCELQFNDTPAELLGARKFGLIKYVFDLMYRARMGVSAQALGISQAAYDEAYRYAKDRVQFGKPIVSIPAVANMLIEMRVTLEANRSLFYSAAQCVDRKEKYEELAERLKSEGKPFAEEAAKAKQAARVANLLTPMTKYVLTESSNRISYDALQIHGGTGYMKEFRVERLARDARITNIYEGTSQLQIVAASGQVTNDILREYFDDKEAKNYRGGLVMLAERLKEMRHIFKTCLAYVMGKRDQSFVDVAAKDLVDLYSYLYVGYLVLDEAEEDARKVFIANRYILSALSQSRKCAESITNGVFSDLLHAEKILNVN